MALSLNELEGALPSSLTSLKFLVSIQMVGNHLGSSIPPELFESLRFLEVCDFSDNDLEGCLPEDMGESLRELYLGSNRLR